MFHTVVPEMKGIITTNIFYIKCETDLLFYLDKKKEVWTVKELR